MQHRAQQELGIVGLRIDEDFPVLGVGRVAGPVGDHPLFIVRQPTPLQRIPPPAHHAGFDVVEVLAAAGH